MVSREANEALSTIGGEAEHRWPEYAAYCRSREQGLRTVAFRHLAVFIEAISAASFSDRREFIAWLCHRFYEHERVGSGLLPDPLMKQVVLPTLNEWKDQSVHLAAPYRWLGVLASAAGYQGMRSGLYAPTSDSQAFLVRAIAIDPADQIALARLIECKIGVLDFHAHHLPEAYLGDPEANLKVTEELETLCGGIQNDSERDRLLQEVSACRQLILDWVKAQTVGEDFRAWCRKQGRAYNWAITRVYVRKPEPSA